MKPKGLKHTIACIGLACALAGGAAWGQSKPLRVGMTLSDVPTTSGQPNGGLEGYRMMGYTLYDALINWKLDDAKGPSTLVPGLATEWKVDAKDHTKWIFALRKGVKFHDGSEFNADAVVWNLDKLFKKDAPQHDARQTAQVAGRIQSLKSWRKIDDYTVELTTHTPDSIFPYQVAYVLYSSPAQYEKLGRDWNKFSQQPSGTGPFRLEKLVPRQRAELVRNSNYWDSKRVAKSERLILLPIPEPTTRASALLSGQVDFIEAPPPDFIPRLRSQGFQITANVYPHVWPYFVNFREGSPWRDIRVRKAVNLAIDREGIIKLLGGFAEPAVGMVDKSSPWFGRPTFQIRYDPATARKLLAEAGYSESKPLTLKVLVSPSGSGQMLPKPMNEYIQQNLRAVGINLEPVTVDWEQVRNCYRAGAGAPVCRGTDGINISSATLDPYVAFGRVFSSKAISPKGFNYTYFTDPKVDAMIDKAKNTFDEKERDRLTGELHAYLVDQAVAVWVVHDVGPRALSPKVRGWVQARHWFQDLAPVYVAD
ncbi:MAG: ABC transporter substrate-binding protein [Betaproteobacteria bacterium]|nr:ABC transporter substrate-binding protein [Betaproteobacteria bacterium]MBI3938359.1 ABC transporter substrate-binding protein [Betaproteobacteria bacterium]